MRRRTWRAGRVPKPSADPARYGPEGITEFDRAYAVLGAITDDTQMTLFTAEGFALAAAAGTDPVSSIHAAYLRWLETQRGPFRETNMEGALISRE